MEAITTTIEGVFIFKPKIFNDKRGYFFESFNAKKFTAATGHDPLFVQDNQSKSSANVLRGLHFQKPPYAQGKLVRVLSGKVLDVVVDIRKQSPTYGNHFSIELDGISHTMLWIPKGMAHGFVSLEDNTVFSYKCTDFYTPNAEDCLLWNDTTLGIDWKVDTPIISDKDSIGQRFDTFNTPFN